MKIGAFGEVLWDVYPHEKHPGGAPLNFAAHLARHGEEVHLISSVGDDGLGREALGIAEAWGIAVDGVSITDALPTGRCNVTLDGRGVPCYDLLCDVAYDRIPCPRDGDFDVIYFGTLSLRGEYNRLSLRSLLGQREYREVFVDVNLRAPFYSVNSVLFALTNATILKISDEEAPALCSLIGMGEYSSPEGLARELAEAYPALRCIVVTLGGEGAYALDCVSGTAERCGAEKVQVVSTVGAGDSFSAAFLHRYLRGDGLGDCLAHAAKVAGFVVSQYAAVPDYEPENI